MKPFVLLPALVVTAAAAPAFAGDLSGSWRVNAKVESFAYVLDCRLTQMGDQLSGVCTDLETSDAEHRPQGSHPLTAGAVRGEAVSFTYKTHFLAFPFSVTYSGVQTGDRITGTVAVPGRRGTFTATRN